MKKAERIAVSVGVAIIAGLGASGANAGPLAGCARCISDGNGPYYLAPSSSSPDVVAPLPGVGLAPAVPEPSSLALLNPAQVYEITPADAAVAGCARCSSDGSYYLALSSSSPDVVAPLSGVGLAPAVPEPSSLALFGSGLLGLYWYRRRRARRG